VAIVRVLDTNEQGSMMIAVVALVVGLLVLAGGGTASISGRS